MASELNDRQRAVLGLVVKQYIETAQPVGSKAVVDQYGLGVSPATIRNEMALLEELGYLTHPHTSAGRVPTEAGYRFFVEHLMGEARLPAEEELMIRHQFHQSGFDLDQWARLAAAVLAHVARGAALVTTLHGRRVRCKRVQLISIHGAMALLVLVLQEGIVGQRILALAQPESDETLTRLSNRFSDQWAGLTAAEIAAKPLALEAQESEIRCCVIEIMEQTDQEAGGEVYRHGLSHVLEAPEFADTRAGRQVVRILEEHQLWNELSREVEGAGAVHVIIGGEGRWEDLSDVSVVLSRYGWNDRMTGLLGVLGPMRMRYGRAISAVRYVSDLLSEMVRNVYLGDQEQVKE